MQVKTLPVGFFEHWLEDSRALILLDSLDEVLESRRRSSSIKSLITIRQFPNFICYKTRYLNLPSFYQTAVSNRQQKALNFFATQLFLHFYQELLPLFLIILILLYQIQCSQIFCQRLDGKTNLISVLYFTISNSCLLYTSPSPRDMRRSRMPSSA